MEALSKELSKEMEELWGELKLSEEGITSEDLCQIIEGVSSQAKEAGRMLLELLRKENLRIEKENLCRVIRVSSYHKLCLGEELAEELGVEAGKRVLKENPKNQHLRCVIEHVGPLRKEASRKYLEENPDNDELCHIIGWVGSPEIEEEAGQRILRQDPSHDKLCYIIRHFPLLRGEAWQMIKEKEGGPFLEDLCYVYKWGGSLKEEAGQMIEEHLKLLEQGTIMFRRGKTEILKEMEIIDSA